MTINSLCEELKPFYPNVSEVQDLYSTYLVNCVFDALLCYTTITLNVFTIYAIRKTASLSNILKIFLLNLAVSDLGVGFVVQPLFISLQVDWLQSTDPGCGIYIIFSITMNVFFTASFLGILAITLDRFLAMQFHLRYQEIVTHKRVVAVVICFWIFSTMFSTRIFWVSSKFKYLLSTITGVSGLVIIILAYLRIYRVLQHHRRRIEALQVGQQTLETSNFANLKRSAAGSFYLYLLFLACYVPRFVCLAAFKIYGPSSQLKVFSITSSTLMFLNSSLNPLIYCWKMKGIRHTIMNTIPGLAWRRNHSQRDC